LYLAAQRHFEFTLLVIHWRNTAELLLRN